jgi:hypothetical protein
MEKVFRFVARKDDNQKFDEIQFGLPKVLRKKQKVKNQIAFNVISISN